MQKIQWLCGIFKDLLKNIHPKIIKCKDCSFSLFSHHKIKSLQELEIILVSLLLQLYQDLNKNILKTMIIIFRLQFSFFSPTWFSWSSSFLFISSWFSSSSSSSLISLSSSLSFLDRVWVTIWVWVTMLDTSLVLSCTYV